MTGTYLEPSQKSTIKLSCDFCKEAPPKMFDKDAFYIHLFIHLCTTQSRGYYMHIEYFCFRIHFFDKRRMK